MTCLLCRIPCHVVRIPLMKIAIVNFYTILEQLQNKESVEMQRRDMKYCMYL